MAILIILIKKRGSKAAVKQSTQYFLDKGTTLNYVFGVCCYGNRHVPTPLPVVNRIK